MFIRRLMAEATLGACLVLCGQAAPAQAQNMKIVQGQAYWDEDPGPIYDSYWVSGQYKYDPNGYMERNWRDPEVHRMTVFANHAGNANCVFRKRVQISDWDFYHPVLRVCRAPPKD
jgi:hypothetical protein